ncbi:MAG: DEAD/DEAH box helicase [Nostocoides sp.]
MPPNASTYEQDPAAWLDLLAERYPGRLRHVEQLPERLPDAAEWPDWVAPPVYAALRGNGIDRLWRHQRQTAEAARAGHHVVVSTGTASGKSLGYLLPGLSAVVEGAGAPNGRGATMLYLAPTKALAADQMERIRTWAIPGVRVGTYDGDTPADERRWLRDHANVVLTNPDLIHHSLLPGHDHWAPFLRRLQFVVIDECHVYRGVFGSHVASVLRRLRRVAARYRSEPTFVLASATIGDPGEHARRLIGMPVREVVQDGSPRAGTTFALWEPERLTSTAPTAPGTTPSRRSATTEAADLLADLVAMAPRGVQTVAFARSRAGVESLAEAARRRLAQDHPERTSTVAAYRGGYLPEERRSLEARLRSRTLLGVAATNALELGMDISGLDAVIVAGWPGRRASLWQQIGRAGRSGERSLAIFVAADDPLDSYLVEHPETITGEPVEAVVMDPANPYVLAPHLAAAAAELPLTEPDLEMFGPDARHIVDRLVAGGVLRRRRTGWYWARDDTPGAHVQLRGAGPSVAIVESGTGRVIGTVDEASAHGQVHTGAVHVHQGQTYVITELDLGSGVAAAVEGDPGWTTTATSASTFRIERCDAAVELGAATINHGRVRVTSQVTGFLRRLPSGQVIGRHALDLPERSLLTHGVWWTVTPDALAEANVAPDEVPGALHAAEHAAIGVLPLVATSDRWDVGGVSTDLHPDTGLPTVLVYDGYPGGAGFAERAFLRAQQWLGATAAVIAGCSCRSGCPACVQSPKCGNGNEPLDKQGAVRALGVLLACLTS